jgi:hypothetical protein
MPVQRPRPVASHGHKPSNEEVLMKTAGIVAATMLVASVLAPSARADAKKDLAQMPQAAQAAVDREANGGKIEEVKKLSDDGSLYKVEIKKDKQTEDVFVQSSGTIVGRHVH